MERKNIEVKRERFFYLNGIIEQNEKRREKKKKKKRKLLCIGESSKCENKNWNLNFGMELKEKGVGESWESNLK